MATQKKLTDHEQIKEWANEKGGAPAMVSATAGDGDGAGVLRLSFGDDAQGLEEITWETWFETFESQKLALLVDPDSPFNKVVSREG